ncbi:MAG: ribosome biogenesis GTPase Der [Zetaproteobacteria bacterium]|nr:ribosome biogenesis GTPase Der [Zetaproteobacteria bacterium]
MIRGTVAIVGRPNVGKSTLFNRLTRSRKSIVDDQPGVTRDRIYGTAYFESAKKKRRVVADEAEAQQPKDGFIVIDTGGFETDTFKFQPFAEEVVWEQTKHAITDADVILFVLDGKHGMHQHDREIYHYLKLQQKPILFLVNKVDGIEHQARSLEFYELGVDSSFICSSALYNKGMQAVYDEVAHALHKLGLKGTDHQADPQLTHIALVGKPNAGKSSLLNRLLGEERSVVSPVAGTTRDSIDSYIKFHGTPYRIIDTAGIRRKTKIHELLEHQSVTRSLRAIEEADLVVHVIDAREGITDQDSRLLNLAAARYKPILLVVNKWDLVPHKDTLTAKRYTENLHHGPLADMAYIPVHFMSCLENQRVHKIWDKISRLRQEQMTKSSTARVNEALQQMISRHTPHLIKKYSKRVKFYYATQVSCTPPTIVVKCNVAGEVRDSYKRYMLHAFRRDLNMKHVPIQLVLRGKEDEKKYKERTGKVKVKVTR